MSDTTDRPDAAATTHTHAAPPADAAIAPEAPRFWRTYALAYAIGAVLLAAEVVLLGTQAKYSFTGVYDALLVAPPVLTAVLVLLVDPHGTGRTLPLRALLLSVTAGIVSVLSTVLVTPLLILMFREGVGRSLAATGMLSAASLVVVGSPLVIELVASGRSRRWLHVGILVMGLAVIGAALSMALAPTGALAASMRLDQGEILMITSSWWLPVYALAAAYARRIGMA